MTMRATLLHQDDDYNPYPDPINPDEYGEWVESQDPLTGEIVRVWVPFEDQPDNPDTPETDPTFLEIPCIARGIVDGGIRVAGTTERFGDTYENIDFVKMWVPPTVRITKRDRITNIKDISGRIRWRNEEYEARDPDNPVDLSDPATYNQYLKATVFNVNGVTPLFNAFNRMTEQFVLLENAEVQEPVS
jgi:hypothetical protein